MNWLNPVNWFRAAAASAAEQKIDEYLTAKMGRQLALDAVNTALNSSEDWWTDARCRQVARGLKLASKAANDLADAIDPDGQQGKGISPEELETVLADVQAAFGNLVTEEMLASWRAKLKAFVREKIGL